jgi:hypothetical protein
MAVGQDTRLSPVLTLEELAAAPLVLEINIEINISALARCVKERDRTSKIT